MNPKIMRFRGGLPPLSFIEALNTVRLISSHYSPGGASVLKGVSAEGDLRKIFDYDDATNDRLLVETEAETDFFGIGPRELVFGIPYATIINAAFTHFGVEGNRFSVYGRNAWYAGLELSTSQAEIVYHKTIELREMGLFQQEVTYDEYLADFRCEFHDLRKWASASPALSPTSYSASQRLAESLFKVGSLRVVYPSVRARRGVCVACFRPALVTNVRKGDTYRFRWVGKNTPVGIELAKEH